ncbi:hypothetical protein NEIMUCOT_04118 [Neisseria mucosa ATCC 25996]|uniref:Uncharacterized protein n=1 Tax=Neisseria mucosa (strain ATCC 25996 / DSM 4631 / NCTC 10774 / M26) TaxID=546266 RepID=D2ZU30_NEIM2|nr:hypothetical protein NEIMUCOT_04118 [Neisseria mucosa ATCC 25996]
MCPTFGGQFSVFRRPFLKRPYGNIVLILGFPLLSPARKRQWVGQVYSESASCQPPSEYNIYSGLNLNQYVIALPYYLYCPRLRRLVLI